MLQSVALIRELNDTETCSAVSVARVVFAQLSRSILTINLLCVMCYTTAPPPTSSTLLLEETEVVSETETQSLWQVAASEAAVASLTLLLN